jgi:tetratricopeptide (TPR) repeat protein
VDPTGTLQPINPGELQTLLQAVRHARPEWFTTTAEQILEWYKDSAIACETSRLWHAAIWHLEKLVPGAAHPEELFARIADNYAALDRWSEVVNYCEKAGVESGSRRETLYLLARCWLGDRSPWVEKCKARLANLSESTDAAHALDVVTDCAWAKGAAFDWESLASIAKQHLRSDERSSGRFALALLLYRAGHFREAIDGLTAVEDPEDRDIFIPFVIAMAYHDLGDSQTANEWLRKAKIRMARQIGPAYSSTLLNTMAPIQRLTLQFLRREAEESILGAASERSPDMSAAPTD